VEIFPGHRLGTEHTFLPFRADHGKKCSSTAESKLFDQGQQPFGNMHVKIATVSGIAARQRDENFSSPKPARRSGQNAWWLDKSEPKQINPYRRPSAQIRIVVVWGIVVQVGLRVVGIPGRIRHGLLTRCVRIMDTVSTVACALACFFHPPLGSTSRSNVRIYCF